MIYIVNNALGKRFFKKETDAYDYAIKILNQTGIKSEIIKEK